MNLITFYTITILFIITFITGCVTIQYVKDTYANDKCKEFGHNKATDYVNNLLSVGNIECDKNYLLYFNYIPNCDKLDRCDLILSKKYYFKQVLP